MSNTNDNAGASTATTSKRAPRYIGPAGGARVPERFICDESLSPMMVANAALALVARHHMAASKHGAAVARAATRDDRDGHLDTAKALAALAADSLALAAPISGSADGAIHGARFHRIAAEASSLAGWMLRAVVFADAVSASLAAGVDGENELLARACTAAEVRFPAA
jgi:hypothetical protein